MITLRPWSPDDRSVLNRTVGDPTMMKYLGGAEDATALDVRHEKYLALGASGNDAMFTIVYGAAFTTVGTTGFWRKSWQGTEIYETGWQVFTEFAGRGIATQAALAIIARLRKERKLTELHAFPSIQNVASNRVCERAGYRNNGVVQFEYPKGSMMESNDWVVRLSS